MLTAPPTAYAHETRSPRCEALAGRVREAAERAMTAFKAAADDRRQIHQAEWDSREFDTLGKVEEVADALHGFAAWILSGSPHPQPAVLLAKLAQMHDGAHFVLCSKALARLVPYKRYRRYVGRLEELWSALRTYFEEPEQPQRAALQEPTTPVVHDPRGALGPSTLREELRNHLLRLLWEAPGHRLPKGEVVSRIGKALAPRLGCARSGADKRENPTVAARIAQRDCTATATGNPHSGQRESSRMASDGTRWHTSRALLRCSERLTPPASSRPPRLSFARTPLKQ